MGTAEQVRRHAAMEIMALASRVDRIRPFSGAVPMTPSASPEGAVLAAIDRHMEARKREAQARCRNCLEWLESPPGLAARPDQVHGRWAVLKLQVGAILDQLDIFSDALVQRSEFGNGSWLSGLDALAFDALDVPGIETPKPPVICYLDRGHGAAIRRARTRLPGGDPNPASIVRIPRERMVGTGIGSSLAHEVGHQVAATLELVPDLQARMRALGDGIEAKAWERWMSELFPDLWSVGKLGIAATLGLIGVVGLPAPFLFRFDLSDPHPFPWIRVMSSLAFGRVVYPDAQWDRLEALWLAMAPRSAAPRALRPILERLEVSLPRMVSIVLATPILRGGGRTLGSVVSHGDRSPDRLRALAAARGASPTRWIGVRPCIAMAALGQMRRDGRLAPDQETRAIEGLLERWSLEDSHQKHITQTAHARRLAA